MLTAWRMTHHPALISLAFIYATLVGACILTLTPLVVLLVAPMDEAIQLAGQWLVIAIPLAAIYLTSTPRTFGIALLGATLYFQYAPNQRSGLTCVIDATYQEHVPTHRRLVANILFHAFLAIGCTLEFVFGTFA